MKLYFLKQKSLDMLEQTIPDNLNKYQDAETWVDQYFIDNDKPNYFFDTGIEVDDYQLISGGPETDFSNAKILYEALQGHIKIGLDNDTFENTRKSMFFEQRTSRYCTKTE